MQPSKVQRIQSVAWLLLGIGLVGAALFDLARMSGESAGTFATAVAMAGVFLAYGIAALFFSRRLWSSRSAGRLVGSFVTILGGVVGALLLASNLTLGVLGRQPTYIVGAFLSAAFLWLCAGSFRLNKALSSQCPTSQQSSAAP